MVAQSAGLDKVSDVSACTIVILCNTGVGAWYLPLVSPQHVSCLRFLAHTQGKRCLVSGSGNVAQYAAEKLLQLGAVVLTMSDSTGYIYEPNGFTMEQIQQVGFESALGVQVHRSVCPVQDSRECAGMGCFGAGLAHAPCLACIVSS